MIPSDSDFYARKEYYDRLRQEAELDRLVKVAHQPTSLAPFHRKVAAWMGNRLIEWGWKLQHYSGLIHVGHQ